MYINTRRGRINTIQSTYSLLLSTAVCIQAKLCAVENCSFSKSSSALLRPSIRLQHRAPACHRRQANTRPHQLILACQRRLVHHLQHQTPACRRRQANLRLRHSFLFWSIGRVCRIDCTNRAVGYAYHRRPSTRPPESDSRLPQASSPSAHPPGDLRLPQASNGPSLASETILKHIEERARFNYNSAMYMESTPKQYPWVAS